MWPFKKKAGNAKYIYNKTVEYKGSTINVWVALQELSANGRTGTPEVLAKMGWHTSAGGGYYNTNIPLNNIEHHIVGFYIKGENYIDELLLIPNRIKEIEQKLASI